MTPEDTALLDAAIAVQANAHAPFSSYPVGSAVRTTDGTIFSGVNVESASFSLTCCAERVALFTAVSAGHKEIVACAIVTDEEEPAPPCGACRQMLSEFGTDIRVVLGNGKGKIRIFALDDLLPESFRADQVLTRTR